MNYASEDRRLINHFMHPFGKPASRPTAEEQAKLDAQRFEATIQAQLRDLFATV